EQGVNEQWHRKTGDFVPTNFRGIDPILVRANLGACLGCMSLEWRLLRLAAVRGVVQLRFDFGPSVGRYLFQQVAKIATALYLRSEVYAIYLVAILACRAAASITALGYHRFRIGTLDGSGWHGCGFRRS